MIRPAFLLSGSAICLAAWLVPLTDLGLGHFSAHMLRHMSVVAVSALLIVAGLPALTRRLRVSPLAATVFEFLVVWTWHLPAMHDAARQSAAIFMAEQLCFLAAGLSVWASALRPARQLAGAGALLLTSMHMTLLGAVITLSPRVLYRLHGEPGTALADQQTGGMIMLATSTPVYLVAGLVLVAGMLREQPQPGGEAA